MKNLIDKEKIKADNEKAKAFEKHKEWEDSSPCNPCLVNRCSGPCDKYDKWLAKDPSKLPRSKKICPTCNRPL